MRLQENLDTQPDDNEIYKEWWIYQSLGTPLEDCPQSKRIRSAHPTGSNQFQSLANAAQAVMTRVYSEDADARSPLRVHDRGLTAHYIQSLPLIKLRNNDLMTFHAVAMSLREFVLALLECDRLCWGK